MKTLRRFFGSSTLSPTGLVAWALVLVALAVALHWAGWREHTTFLSGTAAGEFSLGETVSRGTAYLAAYMAAVVVAPILLLAALILRGLERTFTPRLPRHEQRVCMKP